MKSNETGHSRNAAGFHELVVICTGYGVAYNPPQPELSITELAAQANRNDQLIDVLNSALQAEKDATNQREAAFKNLSKQVSRIMSALVFFGVSKGVIADAKSLSAKLNGRRIGKIKLNEDGTAPKTVSTSQMSYDMRLDNYDKLLKLVASVSNYNPNEQDMKIANLLTQAQELRTLNQSVITANNTVSNARINRNKAFYTDTNNASEIVKKIKNYIRYLFGTQSPEHKQITSINFKKVRI